MTLNETQKRHLMELVAKPYWNPSRNEWSSARALERRGLVRHNPSRGHARYELTEQGRRVGERLLRERDEQSA